MANEKFVRFMSTRGLGGLGYGVSERRPECLPQRAPRHEVSGKRTERTYGTKTGGAGAPEGGKGWGQWLRAGLGSPVWQRSSESPETLGLVCGRVFPKKAKDRLANWPSAQVTR